MHALGRLFSIVTNLCVLRKNIVPQKKKWNLYEYVWVCNRYSAAFSRRKNFPPVKILFKCLFPVTLIRRWKTCFLLALPVACSLMWRPTYLQKTTKKPASQAKLSELFVFTQQQPTSWVWHREKCLQLPCCLACTPLSLTIHTFIQISLFVDLFFFFSFKFLLGGSLLNPAVTDKEEKKREREKKVGLARNNLVSYCKRSFF